MGQTIGKPQITREQLLKSTANSRDFTNRLFLLLIRNITPEDVLRLSRPQECRNYIFMMASSIQNLFESLRIRPARKGDSGVIVYQKIDDLRKKLGAESKELCLIIAYYYIRIFQIFGALAISILDDPSAGQVLGAIRFAPAVQPQKQLIPGRKGPFPLPFIGGANPNFFRGPPNREFAPFADILDNPEIDPTSRRLAFRFTGTNIILFPGRMDIVTKKYSQNLRMNMDSGNIHIYGNINLQKITREQQEPRRLKITVGNFRIVNPAIEAQILKKINSQIFLYKNQFDIVSTDFGSSYQLPNGSDFVRHLEDEFDKVIQLANRIEQQPELAIQDLVGKRVLKQIERAPAVRDDMTDYYRRTGDYGIPERKYEGISRDVVGVPKSLQNEYILQTLKSFVTSDARSSQKTVGFCVARALQLLDANTLSLQRPRSATSSICLGSFADIPSAVPTAGQTLEKVTGLKALDQLYSTKPSITQKEEVVVQKDDPAEYAKFLQEISALFGRPSTTQLTSLDKIIAKDLTCPSTAIKHYLQITDQKSIATIMGFVNQLFSRQLAHTQRVLKFFRERLFRITTHSGAPPSIELHPYILSGGIDILTFLSKEARNILLEYYKGCETTYQQGVQAVLAARGVSIQNPV
jgi:hypothetical protein